MASVRNHDMEARITAELAPIAEDLGGVDYRVRHSTKVNGEDDILLRVKPLGYPYIIDAFERRAAEVVVPKYAKGMRISHSLKF